MLHLRQATMSREWEPFADVQKRMERAIGLLAATGHQAVAAVSHGAAINVLLAGLTNHEDRNRKDKTLQWGNQCD